MLLLNEKGATLAFSAPTEARKNSFEENVLLFLVPGLLAFDIIETSPGAALATNLFSKESCLLLEFVVTGFKILSSPIDVLIGFFSTPG